MVTFECSECSVGCTPESMTRLGWLEKIRSMQLEEFPKVCVGSVITCFMPYNNVKQSNWAPSTVVMSLDDQLLDLN